MIRDWQIPIPPPPAWDPDRRTDHAYRIGPWHVPCTRQEWIPGTRAYETINARPSSLDHGRYIVVDLDENNRHSIDAYCERFPDRPRPVFGWGVCRQGYGLQDDRALKAELGRNLTETDAESWARGLNASIVVDVERWAEVI